MNINKVFLKKFINVLLNVLIVLFSITLLISIYSAVQTKIFKKKYSDFFGYSVFEVKTGSMVPTIKVGDWIIVHKSDTYNLKDIVTYEKDGEYITHKIVQVYNTTFVTRGDANNKDDDPINQSQIVGKVVKILPAFGLLRQTVFNPVVLIALMITIVLFNSAFKDNKFIKDFIKMIKSRKPKEKVVSVPVSEPKVEDIKPQEEIAEEKKIEAIPLKEEKKYDFSDMPEEAEEDDLEKTALYRFITVDATEVDNTFLEIAKHELDATPTEVKEAPEEEIPEVVESEPEEKSGINLSILKSRKIGKQSNSIVDKVISIKQESYDEILKLIVEKTNISQEDEIKKVYADAYCQTRFYNYYANDETKEYSLSNTRKYLISIKKELLKNYADKELLTPIIEKYCVAFILIANLEEAFLNISDRKAKNIYYKKTLIEFSKSQKWGNNKLNYVIDKVSDVQKKYYGVIEYLFKKTQTNDFKISVDSVANKKEMLFVDLEHNISFDELYSEYIIDKTYSQGIIAETKLNVLLTLIMQEIAKDVLSADFNKKYLVYVPKSLYKKESKLDAALKIFNNDYAKRNIFILLNYKTASAHLSLIKSNLKKGYKFAVFFDDEEDNITMSSLVLFDYILVNQRNVEAIKTISSMSDDILDKVVNIGSSKKCNEYESDQEV